MSDPYPCSDFFALRTADPDQRRAVGDAMTTSPRFRAVWSPAASWIAGLAPLGEVDDGVFRARDNLVILQGASALLTTEESRGEDAERLIAFGRDRPEKIATLPGDFAWVHFAEDGSANLVRPCGGYVPLYVYEHGEVLAVSTRLAYFPRFIPGDHHFDPLAVALTVTGTGARPAGRAELRHSRCIPRGHVAHIGRRSKTQLVRYWHPRPTSDAELSPLSAAELSRELREILIQSFSRELPDKHPSLLWFSGGVDSSALAAVLARDIQRPFSTLTITSDNRSWREHELPFIDGALAQLDIGNGRRTLFDERLLASPVLRGNSTLFGLPNPAALASLELPSDERPRVVVSGEFADEAQGTLRRLQDWCYATSLPQALRQPRDWPLGLRTPKAWLSHQLRRAAGFPPIQLPHKLHRTM